MKCNYYIEKGCCSKGNDPIDKSQMGDCLYKDGEITEKAIIHCSEGEKQLNIGKEERLYSEDRLHYIKLGLREKVVGIYQLGYKTSCDFYDLSIISKEEAINGIVEKYKFDKGKVSIFIDENILT